MSPFEAHSPYSMDNSEAPLDSSAYTMSDDVCFTKAVHAGHAVMLTAGMMLFQTLDRTFAVVVNEHAPPGAPNVELANFAMSAQLADPYDMTSDRFGEGNLMMVQLRKESARAQQAQLGIPEQLRAPSDDADDESEASGPPHWRARPAPTTAGGGGLSGGLGGGIGAGLHCPPANV